MKSGHWKGIAIVLGAFILAIIAYSIFGNVGLGEFGAATYLIPLLIAVIIFFRRISRVESKK